MSRKNKQEDVERQNLDDQQKAEVEVTQPTTRKAPERQVDELRDPIIAKFRECKIPMNRTQLNNLAVRYLRESSMLRPFAQWVSELHKNLSIFDEPGDTEFLAGDE